MGACLCHKLRDGLREGLRDGLRYGLRDGLCDELRDRLHDELRDGLNDGLCNGLRDGLCDGMCDELHDRLRDVLRDGLYSTQRGLYHIGEKYLVVVIIDHTVLVLRRLLQLDVTCHQASTPLPTAPASAKRSAASTHEYHSHGGQA